jgi:hypothetical protein
MAFFSDLPNAAQTIIAQRFIDQLSCAEYEEFDFEQTCALSMLNSVFHHVTTPWIQEWHDLFENPGEFGEWVKLKHEDANKESPYLIGDRYTITEEWEEEMVEYEFYYNGHRLDTFDCAKGDDTWQISIGNCVTIEEVFSYTPDPRLTLLQGEEVEVSIVYIAQCDGFLVPPYALVE